MLRFLLMLVTAFVLLAFSAEARTARQLSDNDATLYRQIFAAQEDGRWDEADRLTAQLSDKLLMGHVQHQRYMHPTAYRSSYDELKRWLDHYADHPNADVIYSLAKKRQPGGVARPRPAQKRRWRTRDGASDLHPALAADYARVSRPEEVRRIEGKVRWHCAEDEPTQALNYISAPAQRNLMTEAQFDRMRSWIAASYYYNGRLDLAEKISRDVTARNGDKAPMAYWVGGLVAYRQGDFTTASRYFGRMAQIEWQGDSLHAAAGFWAARTALEAGEAGSVVPNLQTAARYPYTFYGQLALGQLGLDPAIDYTPPVLTPGQWQNLASRSQRIRRVVALVEAGQPVLAQEELRWAHGEFEDGDDDALIALAFDLDLYAAQLDMALASGVSTDRLPHLQAALYPVPDYQPNGGFTLDRSLIFGLIRQESKFRTLAKSRSGAAGLMQLMPRTAAYISGDNSVMRSSTRASDKLYEPGYNMQLGQEYVSALLTRYGHDDLLEMAIAYNWGPGNFRRWKESSGISDSLLLIESVPDAQARDFVDHVLTNIWVYRGRLDQPAPARDSLAAGGRAAYQPVGF